MSLVTQWAYGLPATAVLAFAAWLIATPRHNVGLVDVFWPLFFAAATGIYALEGAPLSARGVLAAMLVVAWATRLSMHLALRNWSAPEDRRYREIRERNEPGFAWKSLYLVFGLQAVLAWLIAAPLAAAIASRTSLGALDAAGAALALLGIAIEAVADSQLSRFKSDPANQAKVMDRGLWRYSRHPNYFGEAVTWWGFGLLGVAAGSWWTLYSPVLMTFLLLRVTGVTLLERDMASRRPGYREYVERTSAFVPLPPRRP